MFTKQSPDGYLPVLEKIRQKTLVFGDKTLLAEFRLEKGAILPLHSHPHEQTGYLIAGQLELTIDGTLHLAGPGDSWTIPGGVQHRGRALVDCVAIEVFAPRREDYLPTGA